MNENSGKGRLGRKIGASKNREEGSRRKKVIEKSTLEKSEPEKKREDILEKKLESCSLGMIEHLISEVYSKFM